jgi:RNA polymerase II subunit A C-terminal domain phosphatase SSU72
MVSDGPAAKRQRTAGGAAAASAPPSAAPSAAQPFRVASICSSNMNRSMEAHLQLAKAGFDVTSYGTGAAVKLPGVSIDKPNIYAFGTPYAEIMADLKGKDEAMYRANSVLTMLERNVTIKPAPQSWVATLPSSTAVGDGEDAKLKGGKAGSGEETHFEVLLTFEERVFDAVHESFQAREKTDYTEQAVHCVNVEVKDNHEDALVGALDAVKLAAALKAADDLDDEIGEIVSNWAEETGRTKTYLHTFFY